MSESVTGSPHHQFKPSLVLRVTHLFWFVQCKFTPVPLWVGLVGSACPHAAAVEVLAFLLWWPQGVYGGQSL